MILAFHFWYSSCSFLLDEPRVEGLLSILLRRAPPKPRGSAVPRPLTVLLLHVERGWAPGSSPRTSRSHLLVEQEESRAAWSAFAAHGATTNRSLRRYCGGDGAQS